MIRRNVPIRVRPGRIRQSARRAALCATLLGVTLLLDAAPTSAAPGTSSASPAPPAAITIVAAENFYADIASQIGGPAARVSSILSSPAQDPHLFELTPTAARAIVRAQLVVYNGIDYDPWMAKLLAAVRVPAQQRIPVAELLGRVVGDNPHIWYAPRAMPALARVLAGRFAALDPAQRAGYEQRLAGFLRSMQPIDAKVAALRARFAGTAVIATEPVANELLEALGLEVRGRAFQRAIMNNTEPSVSDMIQFERELTLRQVQLLIYNEQSAGPVAQRMQALARAHHIPVLGVTETEPIALHYQQWMLGVLAGVEQALSTSRERP